MLMKKIIKILKLYKLLTIKLYVAIFLVIKSSNLLLTPSHLYQSFLYKLY